MFFEQTLWKSLLVAGSHPRTASFSPESICAGWNRPEMKPYQKCSENWWFLAVLNTILTTFLQPGISTQTAWKTIISWCRQSSRPPDGCSDYSMGTSADADGKSEPACLLRSPGVTRITASKNTFRDAEGNIQALIGFQWCFSPANRTDSVILSRVSRP